MGLRLSNRQLKMMTELVLKESKETPNVEWDELLNRMMEMCRFRGMTITWNSPTAVDDQDLSGLAAQVEREREPSGLVREHGAVRFTPEKHVVHPLFRDDRKSGNSAA